MEDNEFEEVTIISHTDHGTSVLPQSTAERLMKEIKLEVTQKISQNENVKLGSLEGSTTPTLLDAIHQNGLQTELDTCFFIANNPVPCRSTCGSPQSSTVFGARRSTGIYHQTNEGTFSYHKLGVKAYIPSYILPWGGCFLCFWPGIDPSFLDIDTGKDLNTAKGIMCMGASSSGVHCTPNSVFFLTSGGIHRIDRNLNSTLYKSNPTSSKIVDFGLLRAQSNDNDSLLTVDDKGSLESGTNTFQLSPNLERSTSY